MGVDDGRTEQQPARVAPEDWVRRLAEELGLASPSAQEIDDLLALAGTAAHTAERWVAPVSTWLVGRAGVSPAAARAAVGELSARLAPQE